MALKPYRSTAHWKKIRIHVLNRDANTCAYCGDVATEVDHIYPKSKGGEDSLDNLVAACRRCNLVKRDKTDTFFLGTPSTPPDLVERISPKSTNQSKLVQNGHTSVRIDPDSPFNNPSHLGAS